MARLTCWPQQCLAGLLSVRFLSPGAASRSLRYRVSVVPSWCVSVRTLYESRFPVEEITRPLGFGVSRIRVKDKGDGIAGKHRRRPENSKRKTTNEERVDRLVGGRKTKRKERGEEQRRQGFPRIPERREFASSRIVCKYLRKYPQACFCLCPTPPASAPAIVSLFTLLTNVPVFPWKRSTPFDRAYRTIVSHTGNAVHLFSFPFFSFPFLFFSSLCFCLVIPSTFLSFFPSFSSFSFPACSSRVLRRSAESPLRSKETRIFFIQRRPISDCDYYKTIIDLRFGFFGSSRDRVRCTMHMHQLPRSSDYQSNWIFGIYWYIFVYTPIYIYMCVDIRKAVRYASTL